MDTGEVGALSNYGLRGTSGNFGTPVPRADREKPATGPVITYTLPPEELEHYRNMGKPKRQEKPRETVGNFQNARDEYFGLRMVKSRKGAEAIIGQVAFWCGLSKDTVKTLIPKWEDEIMGFGLTKAQYLEQRIAGKSRADIAKEQGVGAPGLLYHLAKWGIKESSREEREMEKWSASHQDESAQEEVAATVEPSTIADGTLAAMSEAIANAEIMPLEAPKFESPWFRLDTSRVEDATAKLRAFEEQVKRTIEALQILREFFGEAVGK